MQFLIFSFLAGILTVLSPCSLPLLPITLTGSLVNKNKYRPYIIIVSLAVSVFIFTTLIQVFSNIINPSEDLRRLVSGILIIITGLFILFPDIWSRITLKLGLTKSSNNLLNIWGKQNGLFGAILTGAALGPVFTTCSPTFGYIIATIFSSQSNIPLSILNIFVYVLGLSLVLFLIIIFGRTLIYKLKWLSNPHGNSKKILAVITIIFGLFIIFSVDKLIENYLTSNNIIMQFDINNLDQKLLEKIK